MWDFSLYVADYPVKGYFEGREQRAGRKKGSEEGMRLAGVVLQAKKGRDASDR